MPTTTTDHRADVLAFAAQYPTPNVKRAVALAESGRITWEDLYELASASLAKAVYGAKL